MTLELADGRGALWQWDTGRRLRVDGGVEQIHYQNRVLGGTIDVDVGADGTAIIPDELLQDWHTLTAYAYVTDDTGAYTMVQQDFAVHKRAKPAGYVYTPTEHAGFDRLRAEIGDLSTLQTTSKDNLVIAINEVARTGSGAELFYIDLAGNYPNYTCSVAMADIKAAYEAGKVLACRCTIEEYTATLPLFLPMPSANTWLFSGAGALAAMSFPTQSLTIAIVNGAVKVDGTRLASMNDIPTALKNPGALTVKIGSTTVTYDGSEPVNVVIDDDSSDAVLYKEFILQSTTPGSSKKFKITVDDRGVSQAVEVTE